MIIKEDYVSFEIAKLLKEKGFDWECLSWYSTKGNLYHYADSFEMDLDGIIELCSAPTLQMAMKWLREAHNLHITIKPYITNEGFMYAYEIHKFEQYKYMVLLVKAKAGFENNENACEDAIKYCLTNLI